LRRAAPAAGCRREGEVQRRRQAHPKPLARAVAVAVSVRDGLRGQPALGPRLVSRARGGSGNTALEKECWSLGTLHWRWLIVPEQALTRSVFCRGARCDER
jgi:hypothetical protein